MNYIEWDEIKSNRLYDYIALNPPKESEYFGYQVGNGIVRFCKYFVKDITQCKCLDYGCGLGHIIYYFLEENVYIAGVDMSEETVKSVNQKFANEKYWLGAKVFDGNRLPYESNLFDLIVCTEVIEHIIPKHMPLFLRELYRILKPGGILLLTTPNDEDFSKNEMCCPECNTVFHRYGHCNKFSTQTLSELMESYNYITIKCCGTDFLKFTKTKISFWDYSIRSMCSLIKNRLYELLDFKNRYTMKSKVFESYMHLENSPNLFWVGTKKND